MRHNPDRPGRADRRDFFLEAATRLVKPLASYLEQRAPRMEPSGYLRPPGAIDERLFTSTCQRCGACVKACPANAIFPLDDSFGPATGTPAIDPDRAACVVCDGLVCTTGCPSGALLPLLDAADIQMGTAQVYKALCLQSRGESCSICVDRCPLGESAIRGVADTPPEVLSPGCVGCGVCQLFCPTTPKAIVISPRETLERMGSNPAAPAPR